MARTKRKVNPILPQAEQPKQKQKVYRTAAYARLSIEDSGKLGSGTIEGQKRLLTCHIENTPDLELYRLYCDSGHTDTDFERPAFEQLTEDVKRGGVVCIVVKDLSRFGRNYIETGNYLERIFPFLGVHFVAINDNFDTLTAQRVADGYTMPLKNLINETYNRDVSLPPLCL
jgi:site-specific DNA recombinase